VSDFALATMGLAAHRQRAVNLADALDTLTRLRFVRDDLSRLERRIAEWAWTVLGECFLLEGIA
jgi:hypothetical protein